MYIFFSCVICFPKTEENREDHENENENKHRTKSHSAQA